MKMRISNPLLSAICLALALFAATSAKAIMVVDLNYVFSGASPGGTAPWLRATFTDSGNDVLLKLEALSLASTEFVGGVGNGKGWFFNLNPTLAAGSLTQTYISDSGVGAYTFSAGIDSKKADGDGWYDFVFGFGNSVFVSGESLTVKLSLASVDLNESDFDFLSQPGGGAGVYKSAAHVQGIEGEPGSGWIGVGGRPSPAPDGGTTVALLGSALFGLGLLRNKFSKN